MREIITGVEFPNNRGVLERQLALLDRPDKLFPQRTEPFNPMLALERLEAMTIPYDVLAADIGGSSIRLTRGHTLHGQWYERYCALSETDSINGGDNYIPELQQFIKENPHLTIGISTPGVIQGDIITATNLPLYTRAIHEAAGLHNLLGAPRIFIANDAVLATMRGVLEILSGENHSAFKNVVAIGSGTGLGVSVFHNGEILSLEAAHAQVIDELNPTHVQEMCKLNQVGPCLEMVCSKGSIQKLLQQQMGNMLKGEELDKILESGNETAVRLFQNAANCIGVIITGIVKALELNPEETAIYAYGGGFSHPKQMISLVKSVTNQFNTELHIFHSADNPCIPGAGLLATLNS